MKRGNIVTETTIGAVLFVIVALFFLAQFGGILQFTQRQVPSEICRDSVQAAALVHTRMYDFPSKINC